MPRATHHRRRHYRAGGRVACDTWHGPSARGWDRAPLRTTRAPEKVTCLRCLAALDRPARAPTAEGGTELDPAFQARALACAFSEYQRRLIRGEDSLSGRGLPGHYRRALREQATTLLERFTRAGIPWRIERRGSAHRHILVIGGS
jgi:hypothetical protein